MLEYLEGDEMKRITSTTEFVRPSKNDFVQINAGRDGKGQLLTFGQVVSSRKNRIVLDDESVFYPRSMTFKGVDAHLKFADASAIRTSIGQRRASDEQLRNRERQILTATDRITEGLTLLKPDGPSMGTAKPPFPAGCRQNLKRAV